MKQILALLLVFHPTHNLSRNKFAHAQANQQPATNDFVARQVDHAKTRDIDPKRATKQ